MRKSCAVIEKVFLLIFGVIILSAVFVFAAHDVFVSTGVSSFNFNEDVTGFYNLSINNTDVGQNANITQVTITLPSNIIFINGSNGTNTPYVTFVNTSTILNWTNSTGYLINGSVNSSSFWFNASTSTPGTYEIMITTTNLTGDFTTNLSVIINDTTAPTISDFSCTPAAPTTADTLICTCTGADNVGVNTTVYTISPDITSPGEITQNCFVNDSAGNNVNSTIYYTVSDASSGSTPSGNGGTTWDKTYVPSKEELIMGYNQEIEKDERVKTRVGTNYHYVGVTELSSTTVKITVSSTTQEATFNVGDEKKFEVSDDDFYDMLIKLNSISNNKANFTITTIHEEISPEVLEDVDGEAVVSEEEEGEIIKEEKSLTWLWILIIVIILIGISYWIIVNKKFS